MQSSEGEQNLEFTADGSKINLSSKKPGVKPFASGKVVYNFKITESDDSFTSITIVYK